MLGIFSRSSASRSQGDSLRNRMAVSNVAPPHISMENSLRQQLGIGLGDGQHVVRAQARGQQRLVRVAERGVGDQQRLLLENPFAELLRAPVPAEVCRVPSGGGCRQSQFGHRRGGAIERAGLCFTSGWPLTTTSAR